MITVDASEAKTHLSDLLEQVMAGKEVLITKHNKPIARLVPEVGVNKSKIDDAIVRLKTVRKDARLDGLSWQELRDECRKNDQQLTDRILKNMEASKYIGDDKKHLRDELYERKPES